MGGKTQIALDSEKIYRYYSQKTVQEAILRAAQGREIGVRLATGGFGKRPDILQYPHDILQMVKGAAVAFNISEERWHNPLDLKPGMTQGQLDALRSGWDLVLDIDCNYIEISRITATAIMAALRYYKAPYSVKFSGRSGFHIGVAWESFPENINQKETRILFPEIPRAVAEYLKSMIRDILRTEILRIRSVEELQQATGKSFSILAPQNTFDPFSVVQIDSVAISSRHFIRCVYSLNEKTGLISIPLLPEQVATFDPQTATMDAVDVNADIRAGRAFLGSASQSLGTKNLFVQALDYAQKTKVVVEDTTVEKEFEPLASAAPEESFPPCIKHILRGIEDGRKRATFILVNFFTLCGWNYQMIESRLRGWNAQLKTPLKEQELLAALRQHQKKRNKVLPPNCDNRGYYIDIGVCHPDALCAKIKNPVSYVRLKEGMRKMREEDKTKEETKQLRRKKKDEMKEKKEDKK